MGGRRASITISGVGNPAAFHEAVWELLREMIDMYVVGDDYRAVIAYLGEAIRTAEREGLWGVRGDSLTFAFPDVSGVSSSAWSHFVGLALAVEWERLGVLADNEGVVLVSKRPSVADELASSHFVIARGQLWSVDDAGLHGDDALVPVSDLDDVERARHRTARERCQCGMCILIRPEPEQLAGLLRGLDQPRAASSASWYLSRIDASRTDVLVDMIRAGHHDAAGLAHHVERYASRIGAPVWAAVAPLLPSLGDGAKALALRALASVTPADPALLAREVQAGLVGSDELAITCAELAGSVDRGAVDMIDALAAILDRDDASDKLRHAAVLGLVNHHLPRRPPSPEIRARLEREATHDTDAGKLAQWMLRPA